MIWEDSLGSDCVCFLLVNIWRLIEVGLKPASWIVPLVVRLWKMNRQPLKSESKCKPLLTVVELLLPYPLISPSLLPWPLLLSEKKLFFCYSWLPLPCPEHPEEMTWSLGSYCNSWSACVKLLGLCFFKRCLNSAYRVWAKLTVKRE